MRIGGFHKFSLIDYPGKLAAVIFTQGCNFRCPYCHNPELVLPECFGPVIPEEEVLVFLTSRRTYLNGVVVTGGEPTQQGDLIEFLQKLKNLELSVKLDTNGSHPRLLEKIIRAGLLDHIAMDVKAPLDCYERAVGVPCREEDIAESLRLIRESGIAYEFRTTLVKDLCSPDDLESIVDLVRGCRQYTIQPFHPGEKILDPGLSHKDQYTEAEFRRLKMNSEQEATAASV